MAGKRQVVVREGPFLHEENDRGILLAACTRDRRAKQRLVADVPEQCPQAFGETVVLGQFARGQDPLFASCGAEGGRRVRQALGEFLGQNGRKIVRAGHVEPLPARLEHECSRAS